MSEIRVGTGRVGDTVQHDACWDVDVERLNKNINTQKMTIMVQVSATLEQICGCENTNRRSDVFLGHSLTV